jgi:hypothetical protein
MDYNDIVSLSLDYADRKNDPEAVVAVDRMLRLVEASVNRVLLTMASSSRTTVPITDASVKYYSLPAGFSSFRSIKIISGTSEPYKRVTLDYVAPSKMDEITTYQQIGDYFTIEANKIWIYSDKLVVGNSIEYVNYADLTPLSSVDTTNWLSIAYPDCYVLGLTAELFRFIREWESFRQYKNDFSAALQEIDAQDDRLTWSGGSLSTKIG